MPIATPEVYAAMLDAAKQGSFAYPAINISSSQTVNAALQGFTEAGSDGIIQVSTGGAEYASGPTIKNQVTGALALAAYVTEVAKNYPINVALHTDHCPKEKLDGFVRPLLAMSLERVKAGGLPIFQSHMWDGSAVPLEENLSIEGRSMRVVHYLNQFFGGQGGEEAADMAPRIEDGAVGPGRLLEQTSAANVILEIEVGVVGGEEDGVSAEINEKLYTTVEDGLRTIDVLGTGEKGRYITSAMCTVCTNRVRSSCVLRCSRTSRKKSVPRLARSGRSIWYSTADRARRCRRSGRHSITASSR